MAGTDPPIITFYSNRGGVGRTTALANVAYLLADRGFRVFLWDFDLDAPNLHQYVRVIAQAAGVDASSAPLIGFADYLVTWGETATAPDDLTPYIWSFPVGKGHVEFFGAGFNGVAYFDKLARIHWEDFFKRGGLEMMRSLLIGIADRTPDIILIDARAGISDVSFLAGLQLANLTVLVFRLSPDGVEGITAVHELFAQRHNPALDFVYVASIVPREDFKKLSTDVKAYAAGLGVGVDVEIPFEPSLLLHDDVYALSRPKHPLSVQYERLASEIWDRVRPGD